MSSAEEDFQDGNHGSEGMHGSKKRRVQRACDICRRKKSKWLGDGGQMPGNKCSNCIAYNYECTYVEAAKKRGPPKGYVEGLENRLEKMEKLLSKLCPGGDFTQELGDDKSTWMETSTMGPASSAISTSALHLHTLRTPTLNDDGLAPQCSDDEHDLEDFAKISIRDDPKSLQQQDTMNYRFFGKSSGVVLVQTAIDLKNEFSGLPLTHQPQKHIIGSKRPEFWNVRPWELTDATPEFSNFEFPDDDLIPELVDFYFTNMNLLVPLLHRPTFDKGIADGYHRHNSGFGATVLLVCAIGSRYSTDPRVFIPEGNSDHTAGWKWFDQIQASRKPRLAPPSLYDLQKCCLAVLFLQGSSAPQACWTMVGVGIRMAQDVGAHRRQMYTSMTAGDELWKRAFWCLVTLDRHMSQALGRPCAIQDEDFDLEFPLDCDDEYWEDPDPEKAFKQPPGKPSKVSFFVSYVKLNQILGFALRTIYSINKSKVLLGFVGQQWEQHIVAELDSALNRWIDAVPDHLRWDPSREDIQFFNQSAYLHASYYHLQILIHRPFIPSPRKPSPLSFPSLAICTNAARSCSHVVDIQRRRTGVPLPHLQTAVFTAGIVLLLNIWGGKRSGIPTDPCKEMEDVHKCMQVLKTGEKRWHSNGRIWDVLCELASVGDFPLPQPSPVSNNKRERDSDSPISAGSAPPSSISSESSPGFPDGPRNIAGSRRVTSKESRIPSAATNLTPMQQPDVSSTFSLPMHSDELARLPLHGQVAFSSNNPPMDATDEFWYSTLGNTGATIPEQSRLPNTVDPVSTTAFPMDHTFYEQISNSFPSVLNESQGIAHPQYEGGAQQVHTLTSNQQQHPNQAWMDNDTIAMWSNAPTGFE
ncbi:hypothetical protein PILCRDRAFT_789690 [Piloderma croceum F 1598]|uniref:Zn(2)-C6 fungal-type domain-containing protein n=1 Tax=Piloderma croceum (strain F 1598) TaxID=765440 RepID=A0A0C3FKD8_PILCF|nr:hypothetical protein PILCRDRAFT_789690 [Piloderma croceum F 1598]